MWGQSGECELRPIIYSRFLSVPCCILYCMLNSFQHRIVPVWRISAELQGHKSGEYWYNDAACYAGNSRLKKLTSGRNLKAIRHNLFCPLGWRLQWRNLPWLSWISVSLLIESYTIWFLVRCCWSLNYCAIFTCTIIKLCITFRSFVQLKLLWRQLFLTPYRDQLQFGLRSYILPHLYNQTRVKCNPKSHKLLTITSPKYKTWIESAKLRLDVRKGEIRNFNPKSLVMFTTPSLSHCILTEHIRWHVHCPNISNYFRLVLRNEMSGLSID